MQNRAANTESNTTLSARHQDSSQLLLVYAIYRTALTLIIWALFLAGSDIGQQNTPLFLVVMACYSVVNIVLIYRSSHRWSPSFWPLLSIIASDIFAIHLTAISSGSFGSGMEALMFASVAAGSLFLRPSLVLIVPAMATLTLLASGVTQYYLGSSNQLDLAASGWLGSLLFIASLFLSHLKQRIERSEQSAHKEKANVAHLQYLNQVIIERMQTGIIVVDIHGNIVSSNQAANSLLSSHRQASPSTHFAKLEHAHPQLQSFYFKAQGTHPSKTGHHNQAIEQTRLQLAIDGKALQFTLVFLSDEDSLDSIIFVEDLSKIAQHAQQLKLSSLGKLTASIAHEIRNPLGAVSHAAQLLREMDTSSENQRLTDMIVNQAKRCSTVIESILDVSRGSQSNIEIFNLYHWLESFIIDFNIAEQGEISIVCEEELSVRFDKAQLAQVLTNLLTNALRYSDAAAGRRAALLRLTQDSQERPILDVCDYGDGVTDKVLNKIFEPFFTTSTQGSGLGLYLSRELCEANQCTLTYVKISPSIVIPYTFQNEEHVDSFSHYFRLQFSHPGREPISL